MSVLESVEPPSVYQTVFLALNIFGCIGCFLFTIFLILWAVGVILPEPLIAPALAELIKEAEDKLNKTTMRFRTVDLPSFYDMF